MKIHESAENYLETILVLSKDNASVRSIDIAHELGYSKPSVSVAMKKLREGGLIMVDENGYIQLTDAGREIAEAMYERHTLLTRYFMAIGVPEEIASEDACKIEHALSDETFERIKEHAKSMTQK
ncbi:MAG: metal-dependent transcriptional regulator [Firmicutes bacterium]|nr:metal-dependent transcriptional regulator [Bacillota bacterium]